MAGKEQTKEVIRSGQASIGPQEAQQEGKTNITFRGVFGEKRKPTEEAQIPVLEL